MFLRYDSLEQVSRVQIEEGWKGRGKGGRGRERGVIIERERQIEKERKTERERERERQRERHRERERRSGQQMDAQCRRNDCGQIVDTNVRKKQICALKDKDGIENCKYISRGITHRFSFLPL